MEGRSSKSKQWKPLDHDVGLLPMKGGREERRFREEGLQTTVRLWSLGQASGYCGTQITHRAIPHCQEVVPWFLCCAEIWLDIAKEEPDLAAVCSWLASCFLKAGVDSAPPCLPHRTGSRVRLVLKLHPRGNLILILLCIKCQERKCWVLPVTVKVPKKSILFYNHKRKEF